MDANALHNEIMRIIIGGKAFEDQPFRFMRLGGGYKICSLNDGRALTLSEGSAGLESFSESENQIWEIVPCNGRHLMLRCGAGVLSAGGDTAAKLVSPKGWIRFSEAYLNHMGFEKTKVPRKPLRNYFANVNIGLDSSSKEIYNGYELLIDQSGGNFPKLKFCRVKMSGVCCEVMAAYNALTLAGEEPDFFKLAVEFEMNAAVRILGLAPKGTWGSDPYKVGSCLEAFNVPFVKIDPKDSFDDALSRSRAGIICYRWPVMGLYLGIHTFAAVSEGGNMRTFNRYGNHAHSVLYPSTEAALCDGKFKDRFMVGYVV